MTENETWEEEKGMESIWIPAKAGDSIEGEVILLKTGQYGLQATIKGKDKEYITPSHKVLQSRLANIKIGDVVKIIYEKEELPTVKGQKGTKIYKVMKKVITPIVTEKI